SPVLDHLLRVWRGTFRSDGSTGLASWNPTMETHVNVPRIWHSWTSSEECEAGEHPPSQYLHLVEVPDRMAMMAKQRPKLSDEIRRAVDASGSVAVPHQQGARHRRIDHEPIYVRQWIVDGVP